MTLHNRIVAVNRFAGKGLKGVDPSTLPPLPRAVPNRDPFLPIPNAPHPRPYWRVNPVAPSAKQLFPVPGRRGEYIMNTGWALTAGIDAFGSLWGRALLWQQSG